MASASSLMVAARLAPSMWQVQLHLRQAPHVLGGNDGHVSSLAAMVMGRCLDGDGGAFPSRTAVMAGTRFGRRRPCRWCHNGCPGRAATCDRRGCPRRPLVRLHPRVHGQPPGPLRLHDIDVLGEDQLVEGSLGIEIGAGVMDHGRAPHHAGGLGDRAGHDEDGEASCPAAVVARRHLGQRGPIRVRHRVPVADRPTAGRGRTRVGLPDDTVREPQLVIAGALSRMGPPRCAAPGPGTPCERTGNGPGRGSSR